MEINTDMWSEKLCHKTSFDAWLKCAFPNLLGETCRPEQSEKFSEQRCTLCNHFSNHQLGGHSGLSNWVLH